MTKGSSWRKWDLHIHSPYTNGTANKYGETTIEEFCNKIIENNIACIGLTNYFHITDKEYNEVVNCLNGNCFVIPNYEFRVSDKNNKGDHINIHILFNPNISISEINRSLNRVKLHNRQDKFCNIEDISELGIDAVSVDFETLLTELNKAFLPIDDYIVISPYTGYGGFKNDKKPRNCETEKKFDELSNLIYGNKTFLTHFLNEREYEIGDNKYVVKQKKTILECSDSHAIENVGNKFTWIKAEPTFEGLKQVIFEPEQRAKIQKEEPDFKEEKLIIDSVKFISQNSTFTTSSIGLNKNLNVIIGGKSSGKSILLYSIAKTLLPEDSILLNDDGNEKYNLRKIDSGFDIEVATKLGVSQKMFREHTENSILPEIKYIPQNYLVKLAEPELNKKGKSLNKLVRDLIKEDLESKNDYDEFIIQVKQNDNLRNNLIDNYFNLLNEIKLLENDLKTKSSKDVLEKNIKSNSNKIEELNKKAGLTPEELLKYKEIQEKIEANTLEIDKWRSDYIHFKQGISELKRISEELSDSRNSLLDGINTELVKEVYQNKLNFIDDYYQKIIELEKDIYTEKKDNTTYLINESVFKDTLLKLSGTKKELANSIKPFQQNQELKKQIDELNKSVSNDKKLLVDIITLTQKITEKKNTLTQTKTELFSLYKKNYQEYISIIEKLKVRTNQLENDGLKIEGIPQFNFPKFCKNIMDISDGRSASYLAYSILDNKNKSTEEFEYSDVESQVHKLFEEILNDKYVVTSKISKKDILKRVLDDYFFDFWKITYKNDTLGEMSTGKASFVILMLIIGLSESKAPILIDQPEDNLDNRSITSELVSYLKLKKLERQIIVVTHNANIVVNADAENIIIANQKGQNDIESTSIYRFDYINGAIEHSFEKIEEETDLLKSMGIREHIADIVEGGKEAFKLRELKYRFK
jgi:ABC-type histidine transport system ATPase subunit